MFFLVLYLQNSEQLKTIPYSDSSRVPSVFSFSIFLNLLAKPFIDASFRIFAGFIEPRDFT